MSGQEAKKAFLGSILIMFLAYMVLEVAARASYSIYTRSPSYLTYGFDSVFHHPSRPKEAKRPDSKPVFRIACVGGSTTSGVGLDAKVNNYPYFLEIYLQKRLPEKNIVVENLGIIGATPTEASYIARATIDMDIKPRLWGMEEDKLARMRGPERYEKIPNLVFLYSHVNATWIENLRLKKVLSEKEYKDIRLITSKVTLKGRPLPVRFLFAANYFLKSKSFFYHALTRLVFWLQHDRYILPRKEIPKDTELTQAVIQRIQMKVSSYQRHVKTANFEECLNAAVYTAKRLKVPIAVGTIPIASGRYAGYVNETFTAIHEINANVIRRICEESDIPLFDALKLFQETPGSDRFFSNDLIHLNREGNKFLAEKLGDFLIENSLV